MNWEGAINQYQESLQTTYDIFAKRMEDLLHSCLANEGIQVHSLTSRAKDPQSLKKKISRASGLYADPLTDVTDLAGIRVITYFPTDVDRVVPIIAREFSVDDENSIDKRTTSDPSAFGYSSVHLVVTLSSERSLLPEYAVFAGLKCEIQVRTILQHAWAEIEHDIVYKSSEDIPFELRRKFASLAGMLEVADREFELLRHEETRVRDRIRSTISSENISIPVDLDSLTYYLEQYQDVVNPRSHAVSGLVRLLSESHVKTIEAFDAMLTPETLAWADERLSKYPKQCDQSDRCLIRFGIAASRNLKLTAADVGNHLDCVILQPRAAKQKPKQKANRETIKPRKQARQSDGGQKSK